MAGWFRVLSHDPKSSIFRRLAEATMNRMSGRILSLEPWSFPTDFIRLMTISIVAPIRNKPNSDIYIPHSKRYIFHPKVHIESRGLSRPSEVSFYHCGKRRFALQSKALFFDTAASFCGTRLALAKIDKVNTVIHSLKNTPDAHVSINGFGGLIRGNLSHWVTLKGDVRFRPPFSER